MRSTDEALRLAEREWRTTPDDPGVGERYAVACERAGVPPPLDLLVGRRLPPREVLLPRDGLLGAQVDAKGKPLLWEFPRGATPFGHERASVPRPEDGRLLLPARLRLQVAIGPLPAARLRTTLEELVVALPGERLVLHVAGDALRSGDHLEPIVAPQGLEELTVHSWRVDPDAGWVRYAASSPATVLSAMARLRVGRLVLEQFCGAEARLPAVRWGFHDPHHFFSDEQSEAIGAELVRSPGVRDLEVAPHALVAGLRASKFAALRRVERLVLHRGSLNEPLGKLLGGCLPELRSLVLVDGQLEPGFLSPLGSLRALTALSGHLDCMVEPTAAALQELSRLTGLRRVLISSVCDEALDGWQRLLKLHTLQLGGRLTRRGARVLARLPRLRHLVLQCMLDDDVAEALGRCVALESLDMSRAFGFTDEGLRALHGLRRLRRFHLKNTRTTPAGRNALRAALPACEVVPPEAVHES